jgi:hypothetical protein
MSTKASRGWFMSIEIEGPEREDVNLHPSGPKDRLP